jgi:putative transposase
VDTFLLRKYGWASILRDYRTIHSGAIENLTQTTVSLPIETSHEEKQVLLKTMESFNRACNLIASEKRMSKLKLQKVVYRRLRESGLSAQMAIRAIARVAAAMKLQDNPEFYFHAAVPYDQRNSRFRGEEVSISTVEGRKKFKVKIGEFQRARLLSGVVKAGFNLCYRRDIGKFHIAVVVDSQDPQPTSSGILGVDLGIKNIATDSEGRVYTNGQVEKVRTRFNELRKRLQSAGTRSAKRHLKRLSGMERRFKRDVNHCISKQIVKTAKGTCFMIAMEDLTGIRDRTTVRRGQRDRHAKWAFYELRKFVEYKAAMAGVPTIVVNPKNTSRTCPKCLNVTKKNRPTRDLFQCIRCGYTAPADFVGAVNIRNGAAFSLPIVTPREQPIVVQAVAISQPSGGRS